MRDRTAIAIIFLGVLAAAGGIWFLTGDVPAEETPNVSFEITSDASEDELVVEHVGGDSLESESLRILVYEDRPIVPDRPVHGTVWETDSGTIQAGDRIELDDPRFEAGQRVVVRWFGDAGQANVYETRI